MCKTITERDAIYGIIIQDFVSILLLNLILHSVLLFHGKPNDEEVAKRKNHMRTEMAWKKIVAETMKEHAFIKQQQKNAGALCVFIK